MSEVRTQAMSRTPSRTWTSAFGRACGVLLQAIVNGLALTRISPNVLTFIGLVINIVAAIFFGFGNSTNYVRYFLYAGLVIIGAGIFDMVDGRVARQTDQVTVFGAFFDSVIDRYSDVVLFFGLLVFYARGNRFFYVVLTAFVMITSLMVSYTRARSEALIGSCKVGFMERPERVVLIILGALFERWGVMAPALWVLAVLSTVTVIHRISYTYNMAKGLRLDAPEFKATPIRTVAPAANVASIAATTPETASLLSASSAPRT
jgi:CDP-diacylglycerol--glycerol-3-phosphate 3-phosphatidyltransferase